MSFPSALTTILECTAIAEHLGYLPQFPQEWWEATLERYPFLAYVRNNLNQRE